MEKGLNIVPILYMVIPIVMGLIIGIVFKKNSILNKIYAFITSIIVSGVYIISIAIKTSSTEGCRLFIFLLFIWNIIIIYSSYTIYSVLFYRKRNF